MLYNRLLPGEFRLVRFVNNDGEGIKCSLTTHDISNAPKYSAVSYTWGSAEEVEFTGQDAKSRAEAEPRRVIINDHQIEVNNNLYDLLEEFERSLPDGFNYWIDAICINQTDNDEKAVQVNRMDKIYASAASVPVWLGKAHENTPRILEMINHLAIKYKEEQNAYDDMRRIFDISDPESEEQLARLGLQGSSKADWLALTAFYQRRWFFRVWTIQEATLADKIVCIVGKFTIQWRRVINCTRLLSETALGNSLVSLAQRHFERPDIALNQMIFLYMQFIALGRAGEFEADRMMRERYGVDNMYSSMPILLFRCVSEIRSYKAFDARDRVYGLLGVLKKVANDQSKQPVKITADYRRSISSLYTQVMADSIAESGSLVLLSEVQDSTITLHSNLPSWVLDFCNNSPAPMIARRFATNEEAHGQLHASKGAESAHGFCVEDNKLYLDSFTVGVITHVGDSAEDFANSKFDQTALMVLASLETEDRPSAALRVEALIKTLLIDLPTASSPGISEAFSSYVMNIVTSAVAFALHQGSTRSACLASMPNLGRLSRLDTSGVIPTHDAIVAQCEQLGLGEDAVEDLDEAAIDRIHLAKQPFFNEFMHVGSGRRPFLLNTGEFGLAAQGVRPGDLVCIVPDGVRTPLVLRTLDDCKVHERVLIGEAYIRDLACGEGALKMKREGKIWERICVV